MFTRGVKHTREQEDTLSQQNKHLHRRDSPLPSEITSVFLREIDGIKWNGIKVIMRRRIKVIIIIRRRRRIKVIMRRRIKRRKRRIKVIIRRRRRRRRRQR